MARIPETTNLRTAQAAKPKKEPKADLSACLLPCPQIFSPKYAPINGPAMSPINPNGPIVIPNIGRTITDIMSPIVLHIFPAFVPQNFLVQITGMT
ncbi:hypothetical protein KKH82_09280 [Patescibacteria group bacterium]|nr:hypothetical protein [Patescibacteria group bacterium]